MLQIATGRLFSTPVGRQNRLRGALYTNAVISDELDLEAVAGRLLPSSLQSVRPNVVIYEFTESMEGDDEGAGTLISSGVGPYLRDYAVVVSFALNCLCTPDIDLARRLASDQRGVNTSVAPQKLVRRFFDHEVWCRPDELRFLAQFTEKLLALPRRTFLGVMRSLRTYVNAMHRVGDDLELAYTLLVASVESLAQDFDGHESDWESVDEGKRLAVDEALTGADEALALKVRNAILKAEHVALARRFREFVTANITPAYFRAPISADGPRLGRGELNEALRNAYQARSKYVHQLQRLPAVVTLGHAFGEATLVDRSTHLTLQGLSRLMRDVIIEFVMRQPTLETEPYSYHGERSGIIQMRLAPQYWVGEAKGDLSSQGRDRFEGFLSQLAECLLGLPNAVVTDLRPVLAAASAVAPSLKRAQRLPYLALHLLFNHCVPEEHRAPTSPVMTRFIREELGSPGAESLVAHALTDRLPTWPLAVHEKTLQDYLVRRSRAKGLRLPAVFEVAITLDLAERFRCAGDMHACLALVALAVEDHPSMEGMLALEESVDARVPIRWQTLLPAKEAAEG
ncbi:hypothetical protein [Dyella sp. GSA-30]|uniref:hypothetical protein n=1 Tax=Dyella sp. GSA-30 TaxID=2994496 RepID=UPI0024932183|nr:hypothetical protein [Dyella sp. GSA-30]BDU21590.1 hypothetical protein DYGSA30_30470 [Dyella sp. GSA-30]